MNGVPVFTAPMANGEHTANSGSMNSAVDDALGGTGSGVSSSSSAEEIEKHMSWLANKFMCFMPPKPPWMSQCEYWKQKRGPLKLCIDRKQSWDDKWDPGRHATNISQMIRELSNIDRLIEKLCKEDCK